MICPITYEQSATKYSLAGIKKLSKNITELNDLPFSPDELRQEATIRASKMSIQGVQPKLSAIFNPKSKSFEIVDFNGKYILKPPHLLYSPLPENEDLSMRLAAIIGIEVPFHEMIYTKDQKLAYFIKRYDRAEKNRKLHVEDFA